MQAASGGRKEGTREGTRAGRREQEREQGQEGGNKRGNKGRKEGSREGIRAGIREGAKGAKGAHLSRWLGQQVLQWPNGQRKIDNSKVSNDFTLHGLWPSNDGHHPSCTLCHDTAASQVRTIRTILVNAPTKYSDLRSWDRHSSVT